MSEFDFNVESIISIQPKKRRKENVINNINTLAKSSFMVSKNRELGITKDAEMAVQQSLLGQIIGDINLTDGAEINTDVGMNALKPEILGLFDLFRLDEDTTESRTIKQFY